MNWMKALVAAVSLLPSHAYAQTSNSMPDNYNAETMLKLCTGAFTDVSDELQSVTCTFRLQGVVDMMLYNCISRADGFEPAPLLTASPLASRGAIRQAFVNYMQSNPDVWGQHWTRVVNAAMVETFPCEN